MARTKGDLLQGTLGMLILKALAAQDLHGYGIARWIEEVSKQSLSIEEGSLYPGLRRLEDRGWVESEWTLSDTGRRVRVYSLTRQGRSQLKDEASIWLEFAKGITLVLRSEPSWSLRRSSCSSRPVDQPTITTASPRSLETRLRASSASTTVGCRR